MEIGKLSTRAERAGQAFQIITQDELATWARSRNLTLRQTVGEALRAGVFPEWYERNFPSLSCLEQLKLFDSTVLIAGLGGLGGVLAEFLARVGVGCLLLADGDVFAPSNLNRQWLATLGTLGANKAEVTARHLREINPALWAEAIPVFLTPKNLADYLSKVQVVVDGLDTLQTRQELFEAAGEAAVPLVHGAVLGRFGQVATILPGEADGFIRIYSDKGYKVARGREILAPIAGVTASLQAQEAIRLLIGHPPVYHGRLAFFDGDTGLLEILPLE